MHDKLWLDVYYNGVTNSTNTYSSGDVQVTFPSTSDSLWSFSSFLRARTLTMPLLIKSLCFKSGGWAFFFVPQKHKYPHLRCVIMLLCIMCGLTFSRRSSKCPKGKCCSVWGMQLIYWMLPLATHCHMLYHLHPFYFVLFKFKGLVAKQHPTASTCTISSWSMTRMSFWAIFPVGWNR